MNKSAWILSFFFGNAVALESDFFYCLLQSCLKMGCSISSPSRERQHSSHTTIFSSLHAHSMYMVAQMALDLTHTCLFKSIATHSLIGAEILSFQPAAGCHQVFWANHSTKAKVHIDHMKVWSHWLPWIRCLSYYCWWMKEAIRYGRVWLAGMVCKDSKKRSCA